MAAGMVAAGLCLVLAFVALVAAHGNGSSSGSRVISSADSHHQSKGGALGLVVRTIRGDGNRRTATFSISRPGLWGLAWSYSCASHQRGIFFLSEDNSGKDHGQHVDTSGQSGHGLIWSSGDSGKHYVTAESSCSWLIQVVLRQPATGRAEASASARPDASAHPSDHPSPSQSGQPSALPTPASSRTPHTPAPHHSRGRGKKTPGPGRALASRIRAA
jgi:hypothetical protein